MIDIHVHYFPRSLFESIWRFFETRSQGLWPIYYRLHGKEHIETLRSFGVKRFTSLVYAHKPGLAAYLNDFVYESARVWPDLIPFGTVYAGDGDTGKQAQRLFGAYAFCGIKLHPFVSQEELDDERFFSCYEIMEALGKVLLCHPGSGPVYMAKDGAARVRRVLRQFPRLKVIIAHCGAFEYSEYDALASDYENVYFDTAMNCVTCDPFPHNCPGRDFFVRHASRILFGSDYPNIPYPYAHQIDALKQLTLGPEIEAKLFRDNAAHLLDL